MNTSFIIFDIQYIYILRLIVCYLKVYKLKRDIFQNFSKYNFKLKVYQSI